MNKSEFDTFCAGLTATFHVVQWGGSTVWKVGTDTRSKVFAIAGWGTGTTPAYTFKVSAVAYEMLCQEPGLRPAPYLASRGMKWIQHYGHPGLDDADLRAYLSESHRLVSLGFPRALRDRLGLD